MSLSGGKRTWAATVGALVLLAGGCVGHDQVHLMNPSPCRVRCHADFVAPLDPECHGYHPTCWLPWSCNCPPCPPPVEGVAPPPDHFQLIEGDGPPSLDDARIAPEEIPSPDQPATPGSGETAPQNSSEMIIRPERSPQGDRPRITPTVVNIKVEKGNDAPELPDYFQK